MINKFLLPVALFVLSLCFSIYLESVLKPGKDIVVCVPPPGTDVEVIREFVSVIRNIENVKNVSACLTWKDVPVSTGKDYGRPMNVDICGTDSFYPRIHGLKTIRGRWILETDLANNAPYAVIDRQMAIRMYSTLDCIGMPLYIGGMEYKVVGVYEKNKTIFHTMAAAEEQTVYIPSGNINISDDIISRIFVKAEEGMVPVLPASIRSNIKCALIDKVYDVNKVHLLNLDAKTKKQLNWRSIGALIYLGIAVYFSIKLLKRNIVKWISDLKNALQELYFKQVIVEYKWTVLKVIAAPLVFVLLVFILYRLLNIEIYFDPAIMPERLINLREISENLRRYFIAENSSIAIPDALYNLPSYTGYFFIALNTISVFCMYIFSRRIYREVVRK